MHNIATILPVYKNLIGFRQYHDPDKMELDNDLLASNSGLFFEDVHPLLTLDNMLAVSPTDDNDTNYVGFSDWLIKRRNTAISQMLSDFHAKRMSEARGRNLIEQKPLFSGAGRIADTIDETDFIVGYELTPLRADGITLKINKLGLQFNDVGTFDVYLFHSSRQTYYKKISVTVDVANQVKWIALTGSDALTLPYESEVDYGGSWYLVYRQSDTGNARAINKVKDWRFEPCGSCNQQDLLTWRMWSKHLVIQPFRVEDKDLENDGIWDVEDMTYTYDRNYGLNLQISLVCDATNIFTNNVELFTQALGYKFAINMLREYAYNPEFNISRLTANVSRETILYELDGDSASFKKSGLVYNYNRELDNISIDFNSISHACYGTKRKGIRIGSTL